MVFIILKYIKMGLFFRAAIGTSFLFIPVASENDRCKQNSYIECLCSYYLIIIAIPLHLLPKLSIILQPGEDCHPRAGGHLHSHS